MKKDENYDDNMEYVGDFEKANRVYRCYYFPEERKVRIQEIANNSALSCLCPIGGPRQISTFVEDLAGVDSLEAAREKIEEHMTPETWTR